MTDYIETRIKPLRRRIILQFLADQKEYVSNADMILHFINDTRDGITAYFADVMADLAWLEQRGYVVLSGSEFVVVEATQRGLRIADGTAVDDGISRPRPRL